MLTDTLALSVLRSGIVFEGVLLHSVMQTLPTGECVQVVIQNGPDVQQITFQQIGPKVRVSLGKV